MYCPSCGTQNEEGSIYCKRCGHELQAPSGGPGPRTARRREHDDECDRTCYGSPGGKSVFWGIIIVVVGVWVIYNFVLKELVDLPAWAEDTSLCMVVAIIVGIAIIVAGVRTIVDSTRR